MRVFIRIPLLCIVSSLLGCAMLTSWKAIPPPGGCDQCHSTQISNDWAVTYQVVRLADERGEHPFQTEAASLTNQSIPQSSLAVRKGEEQPCFECHKLPSASHKGRKGRFHH